MRGSDTKRTQFTNGQLKLEKLLNSLGFSTELEVEFGEYTVDIYVRSNHIAFEFDGPGHNKKYDRKRDCDLCEKWSLPVFHVKEISDNIKSDVMKFVDDNYHDIDARKERLWE